jgi:hypothetical protein
VQRSENPTPFPLDVKIVQVVGASIECIQTCLQTHHLLHKWHKIHTSLVVMGIEDVS